MHTAHFTLPKHTNSDQPSTEAAKKNVLAENHLNTRLSENTDSMFLPFKTESRHQFQEIWRTCLGLNLTYILLHQRQGQAVNMGRYWSPLTYNRLVCVQSSNPEEDKGGTTSCWKGEQKGHRGVILYLFTEVIVDYLCCIPEQFHITRLSNNLTKSSLSVRFPWHPHYSTLQYWKKNWDPLSKYNCCVNVCFYVSVYYLLGLGITRLLKIWYYEDLLSIRAWKYDNIHCVGHQRFCFIVLMELSLVDISIYLLISGNIFAYSSE